MTSGQIKYATLQLNVHSLIVLKSVACKRSHSLENHAAIHLMN